MLLVEIISEPFLLSLAVKGVFLMDTKGKKLTVSMFRKAEQSTAWCPWTLLTVVGYSGSKEK